MDSPLPQRAAGIILPMTERLRPQPGMLLQPLHFLALGMGSGLASRMPGTVGTAVALVLYTGVLSHLSAGQYLLVVAIAAVAGVFICAYTARQLQGDHPAIVWDEFVGCWIAVIGLPNDWQWLLAAFLLFRLLDIVKPWPLRWLEKLPGGLGIMLDDIAAGAVSCLVLNMALRFS